MDVMLSITPIVVTIGLLLTRLPGWAPPAAGTVSALLVALWGLGAPVADLWSAWDDSVWTLVKVVAIIGGGVLLSTVMDATGAQKKLANYLSASGPTVAAALLMANGVVPFFETVTGFGVAILIGLPLMMSFGFPPLRAAVLALLGLMIGPWGSMAPGTLLGSQIGGVTLTDLGIASAVFSLPAMLFSGISSAVIAGRFVAQKNDADPTRPNATAGDYVRWACAGAASSTGLWALVLGANWLLGTPVAGAVAAGIMSVVWLLIIRRGKLLPAPGKALIPYAVLMLGTIAGQTVAGFLKDSALTEIISSPALWSFSGALIGLALFKISSEQRDGLPRRFGLMWLNVGTPTALYILLGVMISGGGLAETLADALTNLGPAYLFVAPFVAGLSGYITASGTGGNAMFGSTQVAAAHTLNVSPLWMMASHNVAVCWAVIASPARIELSYQLGRGPAASQGEYFSRAGMLRVVVPAVLVVLVVMGVLNLLFLPGTGQ